MKVYLVTIEGETNTATATELFRFLKKRIRELPRGSKISVIEIERK